MNPIANLFVRGHALLYRLSNGKLAGTMRGHRILVLTTRGRKSGAIRRVPVVPWIENDKLYVIASLGGAPKHPAWFHNLSADPNVEVQLGSDRYKARAVIMPGSERDEIWQHIVSAMPGFGDYQKKTSRVIPVVRLDRVA
jgi:deazaflavin-dependent oxidoreductase (nitroreductase family)